MTLFGDMLQLGRLIRDTLHTEPEEPKQSCAALYDLYRALDAVIESSRAGLSELGSLESDRVQKTQSFDTPEEKWAYFTNKAFKKIDESVIELVTALSATRPEDLRLGGLPRVRVSPGGKGRVVQGIRSALRSRTDRSLVT